MAEKQLIVVVEGTAAMGPYWPTVISDYVEKIIRSPFFILSSSFCSFFEWLGFRLFYS